MVFVVIGVVSGWREVKRWLFGQFWVSVNLAQTLCSKKNDVCVVGVFVTSLKAASYYA